MKASTLPGALVMALLLTTQCTEKSDPAFDQQSFTAIFDNNGFSVSNSPVDFVETPDGGYLILAERRLTDSNFRGVYMIKADKFGKFVAELEVEQPFVNPVGDLVQAGDAYYFFAMDALSLQTHLISVDANLGNLTVSAPVGLTYPATSAPDGSNFLLMSYDHADKLTVISRVNTAGELIGQPVGFSIGAGDDVEEPIISHFIGTGRKLPFQVGRMSNGLVFLNGFVNYTFSLVFADLSNNTVTGIVQGQQDDGGISAVQPLAGNKFAASRFNFGDNYFLPNVNLDLQGLSISVELGGNTFPELVSNAPVRILPLIIGAKQVLVYASDTRSRQIGLFFYEETTGTFLSSRYLGFSNPFEVASIVQTSDQGLAICGTTYLAGRFPRICLIRLSAEDLAGQL